MFASILFTAGAFLLPLGIPSPTSNCQLDRLTETAIDTQALETFHAATEEYAALHRRFERALMLDHTPWPPEEGDMGTETLADVLRAARPDAQPGTIFNRDVSDLIRFRLAKTMWLLRYDPVEGVKEPPSVIEGPRPTVNGWWMWEADAVPWPSLVAELPALPEELVYRFVGRRLVLVDVHANLVVDVLENALPES